MQQIALQNCRLTVLNLIKEVIYLRQISGNKLLVKALKEEGVTTLFGYPGACTIDISDELYRQSGIDIILPRHEQALVHEADAYARTTGKVGVCLVTSGPGATNLVTGLATANYDSVPLVCFTGQVARHLIGNDAFQEVDIVGITRSITKYGVTVHRIDKWFPSSKTCECGYVYKSLSLSERIWVCPKCGSVNDRDFLASKNILRKGISELESTGNSNGCKTGVPYVCIQESRLL